MELPINYDNDCPTVSGRELHDALEIKAKYSDWFPRMCKYGFEEGRDYYPVMRENTGGRPVENNSQPAEKHGRSAEDNSHPAEKHGRLVEDNSHPAEKHVPTAERHGPTAEKHGRPTEDHMLSISMAKELCMLQRTEKGKEFRRYFLQAEEAWNSPEQVCARASRIAEEQLAAFNEYNQKLLMEITGKKSG